MRRLIINGSPADLSNEPIGLTWQYFDVSDPSKRYNPFSSTIKLPFTPRNLSIMGYANATGARLTAARSLPNVDYYFGPMKVIEGGTLKVTSIEKDTITCSITSKNSLQNDLTSRSMDDVIASAAHTWSDTYANVMASLMAGTDGWLLPRTIEDAITSKTWNIHNYSAPNDVPKHELWVSVAALLDAIETLHSMTFSVHESGALADLQASDYYASLQKFYIPAFNYILYFSSYPSSWYTKKLATGTRTIGTESFEYSGVKFFAGKSAWEFIRLVAILTGCVIYFENGGITFAPIDHFDQTTEFDLTGRVKKISKYINFPGYGSNNFLRYKTSDNLADDYGQSVITANVLPAEDKELLSVDAVLPGRYYNATEAKTLFDTNYARNGDLKSYPCILYDDGTTANTVTITWTGSPGTQSATVNVPVLRQWLLLSGYISLYAAAYKGEMYDIEAGLNLYQFMQLKPYKLVRINEVGGLCCINKISNFDPYSGKPAKMQVVRWVKIAKPLDIPTVCQQFVDDHYAAYDAIGVTIAHLLASSEYVYFTAKVAGVNFNGATSVTPIADDLNGTVINNVANVTAVKRMDGITLSGTSGGATVTCSGHSRMITFDTSLNQTAANFVANNAAWYLARGIVLTRVNSTLFFEAAVAGVDFTGSTTITNVIANLSGSPYNVRANVVAVARQDSILFSGTKGIMNITCNGLTRPAGFKIGL